MQAIQTQYKGYHFRSRLEARWAVWFDAMGLEWQYEPEGFELGQAGRYLPDFYLPKYDVWCEVKAQKLNAIEREKAFALSSFTNKPVIEFGQIPDPDEVALVGCLILRSYYGLDCRALSGSHLIQSLVGFYCEKTGCEYTFDADEIIKSAVQWDVDYYQNKYGKPHPRHFKTGVIEENECFAGGSKLYNAVIKARSARFEHGQRGSTL